MSKHDPDRWLDEPGGEEAARRLLPYLVLFVLVLVGILLVTWAL